MTHRNAGQAMFPLGAIFGGCIADMARIRAAFVLSGLGVLTGGLLWFFSQVRNVDLE